MRKILFLAAIICLLATTNHVSAQFIVHPNGNAEVGEDCFDPENPGLAPIYLQWLDTITVLKVFGRYGDAAAGGHMTFGDTYLYSTFNVALGELGYTDSDRLWLHGKFGTYLTAGGNAQDTIMYYDPSRANAVKFNRDVHTNGDVTVKNGAEYEIEAASEVTLAGGFTVEKGAAFAIRPACF